MTTEGHVNPSADNGQRAALVLITWNKHSMLGLKRIPDIDWPPRQRRPVVQRECKKSVTWASGRLDHCIEIDGLRCFIDDRRPGDAERTDITAW